MAIWFAVLLGVIQGLTEFLPISSSAHLRIAPTLLGQPDPGPAFTAMVQFGTLLAVFIYFARDLFVNIPRAMIRAPRSAEGMLPWRLAVGTVPIVVLGVSLKSYIEGDFRSLYVVAGALIGVGILMWRIDSRPAGERAILELGWTDAFLIGCAQACALVPGVSRSGATICMALILGMSRSQAARFSFLLGIPAILGAGVFEANEQIDMVRDDLLPLVVATIAAGITGYLSIAWLIKFLGTRRLRPFAFYRIALGVLLLALVVAGVISADAGA